MKLTHFLTLVLFFLSFFSVAQDNARNKTVQLSAIVNDDAPSVKLNWLANENETPDTYTIWRRNTGTYTWGAPIAELSSDILTYTDTTIEQGVAYEYQITYAVSGSTPVAYGYISSGVLLELEANKGDLLLLIDETVATDLTDEITQLENDLYTDGWMVTRLLVNPASTPSAVKTEIVSYFESLPNLKALYLLGHIPVPYSGSLYPDGHSNHNGAWPADGYYGEINGTWTDVSVNNTAASNPRNHNIPGDGKFDQTIFPSSVDLQVSRVDFNNMPVFEDSEVELLRNYLNKAHEFKTAAYVPTPRGLIDQGGFTGYPEGFAQSGFRNFTGFFGTENVDILDYWTTLSTTDYLWSYGCGAGSYTSAGALNGGSALTSGDFAAGENQSTFTMLFGSYFGDWDSQNNLMRASIANGKTLTCSWAGRPVWYYNSMGIGKNIGYAARINQMVGANYSGSGYGPSFVHITQLGDPSLRMYYLVPPTSLTIVTEGNHAALSWMASTDETIAGYNIYRRTEGTLWEKLNTAIVTETSYLDETIDELDTYEYLVKAVKLIRNASGSFYNESLGANDSIGFFASLHEKQYVETSVFPNPSTGMVIIHSTAPIQTVQLLTVEGKEVLNQSVYSTQTKLEMDNLDGGLYILVIKTAFGIETKRLVLQ